MISELWLIYNAICIYHTTIDKENKGINLDKQLFSGFFSALVDFSKNQLEGMEFLENINFLKTSFTIVQIENILVVYRLNTKFNNVNEIRYHQFIQPFSEELKNIIISNKSFKHLRLDSGNSIQNPISMSQQDYNLAFKAELKNVILEFQINQHQILIVDIMSLVQLKNEINDLFQNLGGDFFLDFQKTLLSGSSNETNAIINDMEFPLLEKNSLNLSKIHVELVHILKNLIEFATKNSKYLEGNKTKSEVNFILIQFIKMNYPILKQYFLDEVFFKEFLKMLHIGK